LLAVKEFALKETKQKKISILEKYDFLSWSLFMECHHVRINEQSQWLMMILFQFQIKNGFNQIKTTDFEMKRKKIDLNKIKNTLTQVYWVKKDN
jgi:hypothetical protein